MKLSPATLSTITAVLSAQGINTSHSQLEAALTPLTGEKVSGLVLQPGEEIYLIEGQDNDADSCKVESGYVDLEAVSQEIADRIQNSRRNNSGWGNHRNDELSADDFDVLIVRKAVRPTVEEKFVVMV